MKILSFDIGTRNLGYSIIECEKDEKFTLINYGIIDLEENSKCHVCNNFSVKINLNDDCETVYCCEGHAKKMTKKIKPKSFEEKCKYLIKRLNDLFENEIFDNVVIENQPSFRNPHMKSLQIMMYTYFIMKHKIVKLQNPICKLFGLKIECDKKKYKETKKLGISLAEKLVCLDEVREKHNKIDDICDSILHGISFFMKNKAPKVINNF